MTHDEAVQYFNANLSLCNDAKDVTRLTYAVIPHLHPEKDNVHHNTELPKLNLRLLLTFHQYSQTLDVWYFANANISAKLGALNPFYRRGSSGPHYCSGLISKLASPNKPSQTAPGLPRSSILEAEYQNALTLLNSHKHIDKWWDTFIENIPLWIRIAYSWDAPSEEQQTYLNNAVHSMLPFSDMLKQNTNVCYEHGRLSIRYIRPIWSSLDDDSEAQSLATLHLWNAINAGQKFITIDSDLDKPIKFSIGFNQNMMPTIVNFGEKLCLQLCEIYDVKEVGPKTIRKYMADLNTPSLELPEIDGP